MVLEVNERECQGDLVLRIEAFMDYDFKGNPGHVHYTICNYVVELGYDENTGLPVPDGQGGQAFIIFKYPIQSDIVELTDTVVNQWGADDQVIFDFLAQELGLVLI